MPRRFTQQIPAEQQEEVMRRLVSTVTGHQQDVSIFLVHREEISPGVYRAAGSILHDESAYIFGIAISDERGAVIERWEKKTRLRDIFSPVSAMMMPGSDVIDRARSANKLEQLINFWDDISAWDETAKKLFLSKLLSGEDREFFSQEQLRDEMVADLSNVGWSQGSHLQMTSLRRALIAEIFDIAPVGEVWQQRSVKGLVEFWRDLDDPRTDTGRVGKTMLSQFLDAMESKPLHRSREHLSFSRGDMKLKISKRSSLNNVKLCLMKRMFAVQDTAPRSERSPLSQGFAKFTNYSIDRKRQDTDQTAALILHRGLERAVQNGKWEVDRETCQQLKSFGYRVVEADVDWKNDKEINNMPLSSF